MDPYFNINRFLLILKRDVFENYKTAIFGILTILSISTFIITMSAINNFQDNGVSLNDISATSYMVSFMIIALFFTGMAFKDFRNKEKTMHYLCIPASSLEKMLSMLLLSTIGLLILFTVLFAVFNLLNMAIIAALPGDYSLAMFNPFNKDFYSVIYSLLPLQAVLFAGASTFKRLPLFYTALYTFIAGLVYTFLILFLAKYVFGDVIQDLNFMDSELSYLNLDTMENKTISILSFDFLKVLFSYLLAPIFWIVAWFKIKEKEV